MTHSAAIPILQALADGLDPATGQPFPPASPYQQADTVRALFHAIQSLTERQSDPTPPKRSERGRSKDTATPETVEARLQALLDSHRIFAAAMAAESKLTETDAAEIESLVANRRPGNNQCYEFAFWEDRYQTLSYWRITPDRASFLMNAYSDARAALLLASETDGDVFWREARNGGPDYYTKLELMQNFQRRGPALKAALAFRDVCDKAIDDLVLALDAALMPAPDESTAPPPDDEMPFN